MICIQPADLPMSMIVMALLFMVVFAAGAGFGATWIMSHAK